MNTAQFAMWLGLIAIGVVVILYFGVRQIERRSEPEPIEHGDDEP